ncbi:MAG: class A beta-lactamase-related serine hydrolase [Gammaproteobacteria bacterium]|nr:MAG: class A beta-lactamase-related serine hydrolase [Gammaproteobacteria bacterium]UTW43522.1 beta-lactamase family protein [bacterium SCSIO 12844]
MKYFLRSLLGILFIIISSTSIANIDRYLIKKDLTSMANSYLETSKGDINISAISITVSSDKNTFINIYAGNSQHNAKGSPVNHKSLFQIGSVTKSFTSALTLTLIDKGYLTLDDTVGKYFPYTYKNWSKVTIRQLLNMTSSIPNYTESIELSNILSQNPMIYFTPRDLVNFAIHLEDEVEIGQGYNYTNTNYILLGMIIDKVMQSSISFENLMQNFIKKQNLKNTYYMNNYSSDRSILNKLVSGYYNGDDDPALSKFRVAESDPKCKKGQHTKDMKCNNMSWGGAAGAIVSNTEDMAIWVRKLFTSTNYDKSYGILSKKRLHDLKKLVSMTNGKNLDITDSNNPAAYGLGIIQSYSELFKAHIWAHGGGTIGYQTMFYYFPKKLNSDTGEGLIVTFAINSSDDTKHNDFHLLQQQVISYLKEKGIF